jgi:hypothetical protein
MMSVGCAAETTDAIAEGELIRALRMADATAAELERAVEKLERKLGAVLSPDRQMEPWAVDSAPEPKMPLQAPLTTWIEGLTTRSDRLLWKLNELRRRTVLWETETSVAQQEEKLVQATQLAPVGEALAMGLRGRKR